VLDEDGKVYFNLHATQCDTDPVVIQKKWDDGFFGRLLYLTAQQSAVTGCAWSTLIPQTKARIIASLGRPPNADTTLLSHIFLSMSEARRRAGYMLDPRNREMIYASQLLDPLVPAYIIKAIADGVPPESLYTGGIVVTMPFDDLHDKHLPERPD
jgi:hypothetical protein